MEEVDKIIIQSLKEMGCNMEEDVVSLKQFTAELVVEAAVRCLRAIQPSLTLSHSLPPSMSARYKMGADIAEACIDLGYAGEIGYQTFLYSSETDVRRVFMFLVEKLPKESDKSSLQPEEGSTSIRQRFSEELRQQLATPWGTPIPPCHSFVSVPLETGISLPGQKRDCTPQEWREFCVHRLAYLHHQVSQRHQLLPSIIAHHARSCLGLSPSSAPPPSTTAPTTTLAATPPNSWMHIASSLLYAKEPTKKREKKTETNGEKEAEAEALSAKKEEDEQVAVEKLRERMDQLHLDIKTATSKLSQVESERQKQEALVMERSKESRLREKTVELLPESAANMTKLQELVDEQARTLQRLGAQWERHRVPLIERYRAARRNQCNKASESVRQQETVRQTRQTLNALREEAAAKEAVQARLQEEHSKLANTVPRSAYTRRILEIIGNIKKQREEIDKVVEDTKQLKRDINIVSDRVDRSFTYADEIIFRDCKQDNASRKVYKMLMQLHAECRQVVSMIEETGATVREIRDLEEQIDVERSKDTASKLERITADLRQMKQETASLRAQLARVGVGDPS